MIENKETGGVLSNGKGPKSSIYICVFTAPMYKSHNSHALHLAPVQEFQDTSCDTVHGQYGETNQTQSSCQQSSVDTVDCVMMGGRAAGAGVGVDPHHWIITQV